MRELLVPPLKRNALPTNEVWNLTDIYADDETFYHAIGELREAVVKFGGHAETLGTNDETFLEYLKDRDEVLSQALRIFTYAELKLSEDGSDAHAQELYQRALSVWQRVEQELSRLRSCCLALSEETLKGFANATGELTVYREYITELLHVYAHQLAPEAEAALAGVSETLNAPGSLYRAVTSGDLRCGTVPDERGEEFLVTPFSVMLRSETSFDADFRRRAYDALNAGLAPYHNMLGGLLSTEIKKNVALAKLRGYESTADMLLHEATMDSPSDNVTVEFFDRVPTLILKELAPHMQRYARLRAKVWGVDKINFCDVKAPAVDTSAERLPFAEVERVIPEAVDVMGQEYRGIVERAFQEKWIYRGDNIGAASGAFCAPVPGTHPYVFDPYHGILYDAFTLIHELGHAAHAVYAQSAQVQQNRSSSRLFVEAPSTFNEHLLGRYLRQTGNDETRLRTACVQIFTFHHNFVTHLIEGELLRRLYRLADQGQVITTAVLDQTQLSILQEFWGDTVEFDDAAATIWMRQPHYYAGLYPYTYSVGLTASTALAARMEQGENVAINWIEALKRGGSMHALELFKSVGIDLTSDEPYREAVSYVGNLIAEVESQLG